MGKGAKAWKEPETINKIRWLEWGQVGDEAACKKGPDICCVGSLDSSSPESP